jgi:hypothetical protein
MPDLVERIADGAANAVLASRSKAFEAAVREFVFALQTVPDYPAADMSNEGFARVNGLAEQVISEIERRLDGTIGDRNMRERLTESIYDIRRGIEEAFRWRKHYLRS